MHVLWLGRQRDVAVHVAARRDEFCLALVPRLEDFGGGRAAQDAWVDEAGEAHAGDVAGGAEDAYMQKKRTGLESASFTISWTHTQI